MNCSGCVCCCSVVFIAGNTEQGHCPPIKVLLCTRLGLFICTFEDCYEKTKSDKRVFFLTLTLTLLTLGIGL